MLHLELKDLSGMGADLSLLGFTAQELAIALNAGNEPGLTDENEIPDIAETAISTPGDIWCLGPHRLACGDSTDPQIVRTLLGDAKPQLMVTDPPYGVEYDPAWRHRLGVNKSIKGEERRACRLGRGVGALPREHSLCLARRPSCRDGGREP